jgi:hypothetical protein
VKCSGSEKLLLNEIGKRVKPEVWLVLHGIGVLNNRFISFGIQWNYYERQSALIRVIQEASREIDQFLFFFDIRLNFQRILKLIPDSYFVLLFVMDDTGISFVL